MSTRTCQLPGCERPCRTVPRGGRCNYCSPEHTRMARRANARTWPSTVLRPSKAADVDHVVVLRALRGESARRLNLPERRLAEAELTRRGMSAVVIAERIGASRRTVEHYRAARRQETAA